MGKANSIKTSGVVVVFRSQFLYLLLCTVRCGPPADPIMCFSQSRTSNCTITNSYGAYPDRRVCRAADIMYPTSEEELVSVVAKGTMSKRKMKVVARYSHSIPELVCPDGEEGLLISTRYLNRTLFPCVTLRLERLFKRSITFLVKNDSDLGDQKVVYRIDDRVYSNDSGNGQFDFIGFQSSQSLALAIIRSSEENQESTSNADGKCVDAKSTTWILVNRAYGQMNNDIGFTGYPVVGYHNRLQASGICLDSPEDGHTTVCPWDPRGKAQFFHQTTFSVGLSKVKSFIQDVQKLRELEPKALCGLELYNGILMRYVKASTAYLGKQEVAVDFEMTYYRSSDLLRPRLYEDILEEIEQIGLFKYGGLPHWGKNRNLAFNGAINMYGRNAEAFLRMKQRYDPRGLFSSEWTDKVLGIQNTNEVTILEEGCVRIV
ncbi:hypothetical protein NE237_011769 [Protea cynaroides]|uniref:D-arabinono-1,4-lactone oxidase C-terminal domain-containing protein n=1 Tax=Protea cynaroides TaxID=273540 RepID=A0A9Q0GXS8_9MAGN|nr:hypothetical protein NE237_011769 [Protea cynaroides]